MQGKPVTSTFVLDVDGTWKHTTSTLPGSDHQVGTEAPGGNEFDANMNAFVKALQDRDCKDVFRLMSPESEVLQAPRDKEAAFCEQLAPAFDQDDTFIGRAAADQDAKPVPLAKTLDLAFYGLSLDGGRYYYTLAMHRAIQTVPGARDHERDSVINWYLAKE